MTYFRRAESPPAPRATVSVGPDGAAGGFGYAFVTPYATGAGNLIAGASFVVGVDTGLLHLAAAFGVPLAAIFTASEPGLTGPMGSGPIAVLGSKGVVPPVDEVLAAVARLTA